MYLTDPVAWKLLTTTKESENKSSELKRSALNSCGTGKYIASIYFQSVANFVGKYIKWTLRMFAREIEKFILSDKLKARYIIEIINKI